MICLEQYHSCIADLEKVENPRQNSVICDKGRRETCVFNVDVPCKNLQILIAYPQFWILSPPFSILIPQISFIKPQFYLVNYSSSILTQKYRIFDSKCPQNSMIFDKKVRKRRLQLFTGLCIRPIIWPRSWFINKIQQQYVWLRKYL